MIFRHRILSLAIVLAVAPAAMPSVRGSPTMEPLRITITANAGTVWGTVWMRYTSRGKHVARSCHRSTCALQVPVGTSVLLEQTPADWASWPFKDWLIRTGGKMRSISAPSTSLQIKVSTVVAAVYAAAGPWVTATPMPVPRCCLAAAAGPDGRIYAIGGAGDNALLHTVEAYSPLANSWTKLTPMPTARADLAAVAGPDGHIYTIGGLDLGTGGMMQVLDTVEVYDPATDTWNTAAPMPTARCCLAAVPAPDGRIYAVGGAMMHNNVFRPLDTVEAYNPATNAWSAVAPLPAPRMGLAAATGSDGRIYVMGGADLIGGILSTVEAYNPSTNRWTAVAPMPTARSSLTAVTGSDGRIDAIGGFDSSFSVLTTVESYDPATNTWSAAPSMPTPRCCLAAAPGPDTRIYALGGSGDNSTDSALSTVEAYTPRQGAAGRVTTSI